MKYFLCLKSDTSEKKNLKLYENNKNLDLSHQNFQNMNF